MKSNLLTKRGFSAKRMISRLLVSALALIFITHGLSEEQNVSSLQAEQTVSADESSDKLPRTLPGAIVPAVDGSFILSNLVLMKEAGSTRLNGVIRNETGRNLQEATFEIRAFDEKGNQLKGVEETIIFQINSLDASKSASLDKGEGVWLEGIPIESISKIEIARYQESAPQQKLNEDVEE